MCQQHDHLHCRRNKSPRPVRAERPGRPPQPFSAFRRRWRRAAAERARGLGHAPVHAQLVVPRRVRRAGRPVQREELAGRAQRRRATATRHLPRSRTPLSRAIFLLHARRLTDVLLLSFCAAAGRGAWAWSQWTAWRRPGQRAALVRRARAPPRRRRTRDSSACWCGRTARRSGSRTCTRARARTWACPARAPPSSAPGWPTWAARGARAALRAAAPPP